MHLGSWLTCYAILYINLALENYFFYLDFLNSCKAIFPNIYLYMIIPLKATRGIDVKLVGLHCIIWNAAIPLTLWSVLKCFKKFKHRHTKMLEHESHHGTNWVEIIEKIIKHSRKLPIYILNRFFFISRFLLLCWVWPELAVSLSMWSLIDTLYSDASDTIEIFAYAKLKS